MSIREKRENDFAIWQRPILVYEFGIDGCIYPGLFHMKTPEFVCTSESCVSLKVDKKKKMQCFNPFLDAS